MRYSLYGGFHTFTVYASRQLNVISCGVIVLVTTTFIKEEL